MSERGAMSEVRSSELEIGLSSSDNHVEVEEDIAVSVSREVRAFHALGEVCTLDDETLSRFRERFLMIHSKISRLNASDFSGERVTWET